MVGKVLEKGCCHCDILQLDVDDGGVVVDPLLVLDPVDEEVDRAVEGGQEMTQTGDKPDPVWPEVCLPPEIIKLNILPQFYNFNLSEKSAHFPL